MTAASHSFGRPPRAAILVYHRIAIEAVDPYGLCVPPLAFAAQMRHLRKQYRPVSLDNLADQVRHGQVEHRAVAVTLDDGYVDALTNASPILVECGVPATFFVTTADLDDIREFWWDTIVRLVMLEAALPAVIEVDMGSGRRAIPTSSEDRGTTLRIVHDMLRRLPLEARTKALQGVRSQIDRGTTQPTGRPLIGEEIRRLAARPDHAVGAHTVHHLALPDQPTSVQTSEMRACRETLQALVAQAVGAIAYPFGEANSDTIAAARDCGFALGVVVQPKPVTARSNPMKLPRIEVGASSTGFPDLMARFFATS